MTQGIALSPAPVQPGDVLRSKYSVERLLGQGGMAYVVSARHLHLDQRVAIKLLRPESGEHAEVVERFLREARAASKIESPYVARVSDVDTTDAGAPFIVMEYLDGQDLSQLLKQRGKLSPHEVAGWVRQACLGVAEAHAQSVIHRDLKPSNLFLAKKRTGESVIKVLDFGISQLLEDSRITQTAVGMGSAAYMSPEQMRSARDVDARTDVWSLGVTLYELCTGQMPFQGEGVGAICTAVLTKDPPPPRALRPDLPPAFEAVILRCLDRDPSRRFPSVTALADALAPLASASTVAAMTAPVPAPAAKPAGLPGGSVGGVPVLVIAIGALLLLLVVVLGFTLGRGGGGDAAKPASDRFKLSGDTLIDAETKLTWQRRASPGAMSWGEAKSYCSRQGGGYRLPEIEELASLIAVTLTTPPVDPQNFTTEPVDVFWSASPAGPGAAMVVHFSGGRRGTTVITTRNRVRCVK